MEALITEWLNLGLRWLHLITGISWIGNSFYFMWLDSHLQEPEPPNKDVEGKLWMVHSGGFYQVERRRIYPGRMPKVLHWFKWEATFTWLTGFMLLSLIYYMSDGLYLLDSNSSMSPSLAVGVSLASLIVSWVSYDFFMQTSVGKNKVIANSLLTLVFAGLAYWLCAEYSGRAAYIQVGAIFGTLMVLNVWVRILPAQQQMIDATDKGETPDYNLSKSAKARSTHNSYMTLPVLFMMISNHYPGLYGHPQNWLVIILLVIFGALVRHFMLKQAKWVIPSALGTLALLIYLTSPFYLQKLKAQEHPSQVPEVSFAEIQNIINLRCLSCHSNSPLDATFGVAPGGVSFDNPEAIHQHAERISVRAVQTSTMPLGNKTKMTDKERTLLGAWLNQRRTE